MKNYVLLNINRYKNNNVEIKDGIKVIYGERCVPNEQFDLVSLLKYGLDSNEVICNYYNIPVGYCPNYLKNKLKHKNNKSLNSVNPNKIIKEFEKELKNQMHIYESLYSEEECFKIIRGFGQYIFNSLKVNNDEFWKYISTIQPFVKKDFEKIFLKSIKKEDLESIINEFIQKYGFLAVLNKYNGEEWIDIIYTSLLTHIIMTLIETIYSPQKSTKEKFNKCNRFFKKLKALNGNKINIIEVIRTLFKNLKNAEGSRLCWGKIKVLKLKSDTKIVREMEDIIGFTINYMDNLYFENSQYYEFYQADMLVDLLEEHREYLKKIGKKEADKYTYETLDKSYTRYVLKY